MKTSALFVPLCAATLHDDTQPQCAQNFAALSHRALTTLRESTLSAERSNCVSGEQPARNSAHNSRRVELFLWLQFGEAYSALRGWRPIPAALQSHSVLRCSGTEDISLPTHRPPKKYSDRPHQGRNIPDKMESIRKRTCSVKSSFAGNQWKSLCKKRFRRLGASSRFRLFFAPARTKVYLSRLASAPLRGSASRESGRYCRGHSGSPAFHP